MAHFDHGLHVRYFSYSLRHLPQAYDKLDTNRLTLVHFCVHALDLLGVWDNEQSSVTVNRNDIIEWIYSLQNPNGGFLGGTFLGPDNAFQHGHIAMTYTALCTLTALGDDLERVNRSAIINSLKPLQLSNGSFSCVAFGSEHDMRFLYCACAISHILNDWSQVDVDKAIEYIRSCRAYDGAIALVPGQEGHGGSTFCAVASLVLIQKLDLVMDEEWRNELIHWCVQRQIGGLQGRPNKLEDTCYSYWIGGTLRLLGCIDLLNHNALRAFVMECQTSMGGFSKQVGMPPDVLHAFYSMCYLSMSQTLDDDNPLKALNCTLGVAQETACRFAPIYP